MRIIEFTEEEQEDIQAHLGRATSHIKHAMELMSHCHEDKEESPEQEEHVEMPTVVRHDPATKQIILRY